MTQVRAHVRWNVTARRRRDILKVVAKMIPMLGTASVAFTQPKEEMYGQIGKIIAISGRRDEVIKNILDAIDQMPGCLSYIVAKDTSNANAIWITEVWDSKASHDASLSIPSVKTAIAKNIPLIAGFGDGIETVPVGGHGTNLPKPA